jgi:hypothetical protein
MAWVGPMHLHGPGPVSRHRSNLDPRMDLLKNIAEPVLYVGTVLDGKDDEFPLRQSQTLERCLLLANSSLAHVAFL